MRERSPPLPKIAHPSFPRLGKSQASTWLSAMHKSPPEGTAFLITVSPVPGKLTINCQSPAFIATSTVIKLWSAVHEYHYACKAAIDIYEDHLIQLAYKFSRSN